MENNDYSVPRRMSKSAFVVLWFKELRNYIGAMFLLLTYNIFNSQKSGEITFFGILEHFLVLFACMLLLCLVIAFFDYYYKTYYVSGGNLIFKHGVFSRETTTIPLQHIHSMRTKRGFVYQLLDMTGVSFDTLASVSAEIELILDDADWEALFRQVETQETVPAEEQDMNENQPSLSPKVSPTMRYSNMNLLKGAFCQNHFRGMVILGGILIALYNKMGVVGNQAMGYALDYIDHTAYITHSFALVSVLVATAYLVSMLLWMVKAFLSYYNTELRTSATRLFFEHGLFTRRSAQFSVDKVCTVVVKQNVMEKWLKGSTVELRQALFVVGGEDKEENKVKIYGVPSADVILQWWLGKDHRTSATLFEACSGNGVFGHTVKWDLLAVGIAAGVLVHFGQYLALVCPLAYLLFALVKGGLAVRKSRITLKNDYLEICSGKLADELSYLKYENIEGVCLVRSPLTPIFRRVRLCVYTNGSSYNVYSLKKDEALVVYELLLHWCRG